MLAAAGDLRQQQSSEQRGLKKERPKETAKGLAASKQGYQPKKSSQMVRRKENMRSVVYNLHNLCHDLEPPKSSNLSRGNSKSFTLKVNNS